MRFSRLGQAGGNPYVWEPGDSPVRIQILPSILDRLGAVVLETSGAVEKRETGGVLVGTTKAADGKAVIEIVDFEPVACSRKDQYVLACRDQDVFAGRCAHWTGHPAGLRAVGFYHSRQAGPIRLDPADLSLAHRFFAGPESTFLVIQAKNLHTITAGFFCWDADGTLGASPCTIEVTHQLGAVQQPAAPPAVTGASSPLPAAQESPRFAVRGSTHLQNPVATTAKPAAKMSGSGFGKWLFSAAGILAVAGLAALGGLVTKQHSAPPAGDPEALRVERDGSDLRVIWNRSAPLFRSARGAVLSVREGGYARDFGLDMRMDSGSLLYPSKGEDVEVCIHVFAANSERTETVRVPATLAAGAQAGNLSGNVMASGPGLLPAVRK